MSASLLKTRALLATLIVFILLSVSLFQSARAEYKNQAEYFIKCEIKVGGRSVATDTAEIYHCRDSDAGCDNDCMGTKENDCNYKQDESVVCQTNDCSEEGDYMACAYRRSGTSDPWISIGECITYKTVNYDVNLGDCQCLGKNWINNPNYFESGTTPKCCGDDPNEFYNYRKNGGDAWTNSTTDNACCDTKNDCVESHACISSGAVEGTYLCLEGQWYGGDSGQDACNEIVGSGYWELGGEVAKCCGDDSNEFRITTQEQVPGEGALSHSTDDDVACCDTVSDCVFKDVCYANNALNGEYTCENGIWHDYVKPTVTVTGEPSDWSNTDETATVDCKEGDTPNSGCDSGTYKTFVSPSDPGSCPIDLGSYTDGTSVTISEHSWVCSYGEDKAKNSDYSDSPVEFKVDQTIPHIETDYKYNDSYVAEGQVITVNATDKGDSQIKEVRVCSKNCNPEGPAECDPDTGYAYCQSALWSAGANNDLFPKDPNHCEFQLKFQDSTCKHVKIKVWDNAGNTNMTELIVKIDTKLPSVKIKIEPDVADAFNDPNHFINEQATAEVVCSDPESGIGVGEEDCDSNGCLIGSYKLAMIFANETKPTGSDPCSDTYIAWDGSNEKQIIIEDPDIGPGIQYPITSHYWLCAMAKDCKTKKESYSPAVYESLVDMDSPVSWIEEMPEWTNAKLKIDVSWDGDDNGTLGSGINNYTVEYNISGAGSENKGWTPWLTDTTKTSDTFYSTLHYSDELINGATYCFRVRAKDKVGNQEPVHAVGDQCITIDRTPPACSLDIFSLDEVKEYINAEEYKADPQNGFTVSWTGNDNVGEIAYYDIWYKRNSSMPEKCSTIDWKSLTGETQEESLSTTDYFEAFEPCTYYFQCRVADGAGNIGYSEIKHTTIDNTPPEAQIVRPTMEWASESFNLTWEGTDQTSGIACYEVQWTDQIDTDTGLPIETGFQYIRKPSDKIDVTDCATLGSQNYVIFNDSVQGLGDGSLDNGDQFFFRVRAKDIAGNLGEWNGNWEGTTMPYNVTIDTSIPELEVFVTDQDGNPITTKVVNAKDVYRINIRSVARDALSGIQSNLISYDVLMGNIRTIESHDCGPAGSYGRVSDCTKTLEYGEDVVIKFRVSAMDRAGNFNQTKTFYVVTHPFANFIGNDIIMTLGDTYIAQVQVRNLQDFVDTVTVYFTDGSYPLASFIDMGIGEFEQENRLLRVKLNPDEEKTFHVNILSSEPEENFLRLKAFSEQVDPEKLNDTDQLTITTTFPAAFPGLDGFASLLLIVLSLPVYAFMKRKKLL